LATGRPLASTAGTPPAVDGQDHGLAVDGGGVVERALEVEHQARTLAGLHHVDAAQVALVQLQRTLPVALTVAPKSSAMRGGLVMAKLIGSLSGAFSA
jgi:hypothetical protein